MREIVAIEKLILPEIRSEIIQPIELKRLFKDPGESVREFNIRTRHLKENGVYFLAEALPLNTTFAPDHEAIVYIGKASGSGERIYERCRKHFWSITAKTSPDGKAKTRPGNGFIHYRDSVSRSAENLWVFPVIIFCDGKQVGLNHRRYLISLVEEYFIAGFAQINGRLPFCNSKF